MSMAGTEQDTEVLRDLDFTMITPCEIKARAAATGATGLPCCPGDPAEWVAWATKCCATRPTYMLICDYCRQVFLRWQRQRAHVSCADCGAETGGPHTFTPLNGAS